MDRNSWIVLIALAVLFGAIAIAATGISGGFDRPENSGGLIYEYQALIAGMLAVGGATIVLIAADRQIAHDRQLALAERGVAVRASKMRLAAALEGLARQYSDIATTYLWEPGSSPLGPLPVPFFAEDTTVLAPLSAQESQSLLRFARLIVVVNRGQPRAIPIPSLLSDSRQWHQNWAAHLALEACRLRNRFGDEVGWEPMKFSKHTRAGLRVRANDVPDALITR